MVRIESEGELCVEDDDDDLLSLTGRYKKLLIGDILHWTTHTMVVATATTPVHHHRTIIIQAHTAARTGQLKCCGGNNYRDRIK